MFSVTLQLLPEISFQVALLHSALSAGWAPAPGPIQQVSPGIAGGQAQSQLLPSHIDPALSSTGPWSSPPIQQQPLKIMTTCLVLFRVVVSSPSCRNLGLKDSALKRGYFLQLKVVTMTGLDVRQQVNSNTPVCELWDFNRLSLGRVNHPWGFFEQWSFIWFSTKFSWNQPDLFPTSITHNNLQKLKKFGTHRWPKVSLGFSQLRLPRAAGLKPGKADSCVSAAPVLHCQIQTERAANTTFSSNIRNFGQFLCSTAHWADTKTQAQKQHLPAFAQPSLASSWALTDLKSLTAGLWPQLYTRPGLPPWYHTIWWSDNIKY